MNARTIKFRARRIDNGKWVYGDYFKTPLTDENSGTGPEVGWFFLTGLTRHCIGENGVAFVVDPKTVCEFTGLHDKSGREIFESDIVRCIDEGELDGEIFKVSWQGEDYPAFDIDGFDGESNGLSHFNAAGTIEVIGNIFENPDLLK